MNPLIERLESRRLLAAVHPSAVEQYHVEIINRARANPAAEAARLGIDLNEGLAAGTISTAAKQPLAINPFITDAARKHSQWMIDNDLFQHAGSGGSNPGQRMTTAGYVFNAPSTWGENIAYRSQRPSVPDPVTTSAQLHADLFIDAGIAGRGHRVNLMNASFREIGAGIVSGEFNAFNAVMLTTDFAASGTASFLTGVAYSDTTTADNFYTPGEGFGGVTITATKVGSGEVFTTTTFASGGYNLTLTAGKYIVTASGPGFAAPLRHHVVIGSENVKRDFRPADAGIIRGSVFNDANRNGIRDAGETPVVGLLVYIDTHKDGKRNRSELYARTNIDGAWKIANLAPGTYRIRETLPAGQVIVTPTSGFYEVNLGPGKTIGGRTFANAPVTARAMVRSELGADGTDDEPEGLV
jgi:uncharacterized protein YkwD